MTPNISIAIETSCRLGGLALGMDQSLLKVVRLDASARYATELVSQLRDLLESCALRPADVRELYVSAGPGSFTGVRVGITVARTLAQAVGQAPCVGVPTAQAVAWNVREHDWRHLGVIFDARGGQIHATLFARRDGQRVLDGPAQVLAPAQFLQEAPRPLLLIGEGLRYHDLSGPGVERADEGLDFPTPEGVWHVGKELARLGHAVHFQRLLPIYVRRPAITQRQT
jgi:tRNA threonylcarbamoyladenosine biosynthesis protein TsaB